MQHLVVPAFAGVFLLGRHPARQQQWGRAHRQRELPAGVNWRILQISREIREPGACIKQELTVGEASKQVAEAVNQGSLGTCVVPSNYGISKGTEGAVGLCARGVSLIPKEIGRHRGKIRQVSA